MNSGDWFWICCTEHRGLGRLGAGFFKVRDRGSYYATKEAFCFNYSYADFEIIEEHEVPELVRLIYAET